MTKREKQVANEYCKNPFLKHKDIAEIVGVHRQYVTLTLNKPEVKEYCNGILEQEFKDGQKRALKSMLQMAEQDHNLQIKYKATEFLLKASGIGNEQHIKVDTEDAINIKIEQ